MSKNPSLLISKPNKKMPCPSFSLPAWETCPSAQKVGKDNGSVCGGCYALKGMFVFPNVKNALKNRFNRALAAIKGDDSFAKQIISEIGKARYPLFRIHVAGDFFSAHYVRIWHAICSALPSVTFWAPTREYISSLKLPELQKLAALPNVVVRPSALFVDSPAPKTEGLAAGSTVVSSPEKAKALGAYLCPATIEGNPPSCEANHCKACFCKSARKPIAYLKH